ncbi:hypothetical protein BDV35DRAFT_353999, partial [Aspergillus flavus]
LRLGVRGLSACGLLMGRLRLGVWRLRAVSRLLMGRLRLGVCRLRAGGLLMSRLRMRRLSLAGLLIGRLLMSRFLMTRLRVMRRLLVRPSRARRRVGSLSPLRRFLVSQINCSRSPMIHTSVLDNTSEYWASQSQQSNSSLNHLEG